MSQKVCVPAKTNWLCRLSQSEYESIPTADRELAEAFAWSLLASLCAYRIGTCPITVRPCAARCAPAGSYRQSVAGRGYTGALPTLTIGTWSPYITGGHWVNACGCRGADSCSCGSISEVVLPGPVGSIVSVMVDGVEVPKTAYRVYNGNRLVRTDGETWPVCQDMSLADDEGFAVTYYRGAAPNTMLELAAGLLAYEFWQSCQGNECRLPSNVTAITRAGESYDLEPVDYPNGKTGIPEVDAVINIYNPYHLKGDAVVMSPDTINAGPMVPTWN